MKIFPRRAAVTLVALALPLFLLSACDQTQDDTHLQERVISGFYQQHLKTRSPGIPSPDELKALQPFLSQALSSLLHQAADTETRYHAAAEDPVPPLVDGDLFTSLFEGATSFAVDSCESEDTQDSNDKAQRAIQRASCVVRFQYHGTSADNRNQSGDESWNDKLWLVKENQQWRIDDIEFIGNGQSSQQEYLTDTLTSIVKDYN